MKGKRLAGIDGLRFISISLVIVHHLFTFKKYYCLNTVHLPVTGIMGLFGIHFFFVGSGFLITYLLLQELASKGSIALRSFIIRRVLRIWPAYLLLVVLTFLWYKHSFFDIPGITAEYFDGPSIQSNFLYLAMLPHLAPFANSTAPFLHPTYTIGLEEQFYIVWGLLFYFMPRHARTVIWILAFGGPLCNWLHNFLFEYHQFYPETNKLLVLIKQSAYYFQYSKFSTFAIGALFAYAFYFKSDWLGWFSYKPVQVAFYFLLILICGTGVQLPYIQFEFMAIMMGILLLIAIEKNCSVINFNLPILSALGKVSYGIYLFHIFAIVISIRLVQAIWSTTLETTNQAFFLIFISLVLATCFGVISYYFFEIHFLRLKQKVINEDTNPKMVKALADNVQ